ncbi:AAA family ATPase [Alphaproteobacteria bacterium endosymbiont of Tiliacea citrago]|uniref:AAA family ATPase n=1 Tax=Alphaproteobacteria bacterium endosymbiont of Tiliacea citrago TaxID=3077944 RepID=UPI00313DB80F
MVKKIDLLNFKKHAKKEVFLDNKIVLIHGKNGSGKTSILEALSLFNSGKGIFNLQNENLISNQKNFFNIQLFTENANFIVKYQNKKKEIFINNSLSSSSNLLEHISILGLTPYNSLGFWFDVSLRRKMFNRAILQHYPSYGTFYSKYNKALKQRNLLINNSTFNYNWEKVLDPIIKENGLKINKIRDDFIKKINNFNNQLIYDFLKENVSIIIDPSFEEQEKILLQPLPNNFIGPHLSKFYLKTNESGLSTGQQRKALLSFFLISLNLSLDKNNLLLLDDVFANLDDQNMYDFINLLDSQNIQTVITHTCKIDHPKIKNIELS